MISFAIQIQMCQIDGDGSQIKGHRLNQLSGGRSIPSIKGKGDGRIKASSMFQKANTFIFYISLADSNIIHLFNYSFINKFKVIEIVKVDLQMLILII